jgi:gliding motility-associated-like protein
VQIFWGDTANKSYLDESPSKGKKYFHQYPNGAASSSSNYSIKFVAFSGISCEQELSKEINILPAPIIQFTNLSSVCNNALPIDIAGAAQVNNLAGTFSYSGKGVTANGQFNPQLALADTQYILYAYTATNSCKDSGYQKIIITPAPIVNAGPDLMVLKNETVQINASATGNGLKYLWNPSACLNSDIILNPLCTTAADIIYQLTATDHLGCSSQSSMAVKILKDPLIPNAFTPNGDNFNDVLYLRGFNIQKMVFRIFDRWGNVVFETSDLSVSWDGSKFQKDAEAEVYNYIFQNYTRKIKKYGKIILSR